jgi:hypothetical protein
MPQHCLEWIAENQVFSCVSASMGGREEQQHKNGPTTAGRMRARAGSEVFGVRGVLNALRKDTMRDRCFARNRRALFEYGAVEYDDSDLSGHELMLQRRHVPAWRCLVCDQRIRPSWDRSYVCCAHVMKHVRPSSHHAAASSRKSGRMPMKSGTLCGKRNTESGVDSARSGVCNELIHKRVVALSTTQIRCTRSLTQRPNNTHPET